MKRLICLDFDGVVHAYDSPWAGPATILDPPVLGAIQWIHQALQKYDVAIYSTRSETNLGREAMSLWLQYHAGPLWEGERGLKNVQFPSSKPPAFITLDDRAVTFEGIWPDLEQLMQFKPWNKR